MNPSALNLGALRRINEARGEAPRSIDSLEGVGDRLRAAAFAEIQARDAFLWAPEHYH